VGRDGVGPVAVGIGHQHLGPPGAGVVPLEQPDPVCADGVAALDRLGVQQEEAGIAGESIGEGSRVTRGNVPVKGVEGGPHPIGAHATVTAR